jgi:ectoine hydroxylase-related dioxygenase (phytanoyl-CoA dioxygenase family)
LGRDQSYKLVSVKLHATRRLAIGDAAGAAGSYRVGNRSVEDKDLEPFPALAGRFALSWALKPGDFIAFNFKTLHGAPARR